MLKSVVVTAILFLFCSNVFAEVSPELAAALQAYREAVPPEPKLTGDFAERLTQRMEYNDRRVSAKPDELSLAIFQASLKSLSHEEYTMGIMEGYTPAYGDVRPVPPKNWRNGEMALTLMENILAGNDSQRWMGWHLFDDVQELISDFASKHISDRKTLERIFKLAAEFPALLPEGQWVKNWTANRRNLIVRTITLGADQEFSSASMAAVKNVEDLLPLLPGDYLQGDALRALGQSRRAGALPYLTKVVRDDEDLKRKLGALLGLGHFAEHEELLELSRKIALQKNPDVMDAKNLAATAVGMIANHYARTRRMNVPVSPRAMEIAKELWSQEDRPDLKRWLLYYLGSINEKFVEDIFLEALKAPDFNLQSQAMEYSTGGKMIAESPLIEEAIIAISQNAQYAKQKQIAQKYLERRRQLRKATGTCENIVTNTEDNSPKPPQ